MRFERVPRPAGRMRGTRERGKASPGTGEGVLVGEDGGPVKAKGAYERRQTVTLAGRSSRSRST